MPVPPPLPVSAEPATQAVIVPDVVRTCRACGAPLDGDDRYCQACGQDNGAADQVAAAPATAQKHLRCNNCGAEVSIDPLRRSYTCPFCDSNYVIEIDADASGHPSPEFVIGFSITNERAQEIFREWLGRRSFFRPGDLRKSSVAGKLQGVYLPFWSFSMLAQSSWSASIGEYWYRTETYTTTVNGKTVTRTRQVQETEWWPLAGRHHQYHSGYLVSGSRGLKQEDAERVKPFKLEALKRYAPKYLAGWSSEECSVERQDALQRCSAEFEQRQQQAVAGFLPGDTYSQLQVSTRFSRVNSDLVLLPIYLLSYQYRGKLYRFLLNGQTGRCDGDKPWSTMRIGGAIGVAFLIAAIVALVAALLNS